MHQDNSQEIEADALFKNFVTTQDAIKPDQNKDADDLMAEFLLNKERRVTTVSAPPPVDVATGNIRTPAGRFGIVQTQATQPTRADIARSQGFDPAAEGGGVSERLAGGFGEITDVQNALSAGTNFKPEDFEVINVEDLGIVFKGPEDEKFKLLDPTGLDVGDVATGGLDVIPTVAEGATLVATKSPVAAAIVGGGTRGAILSALKATGVVADPAIVTEALLEAGLSLVGAKAPGAVKQAKRFISPERRAIEGITEQATEKEFKAGAKKAAAVATDVERIGGVKPKFTVGEELATTEPEKAAKLVGAEKAAGSLIGTERSKRLAAEGLKARLERGAAEGVEDVGEAITAKQANRVDKAIKKAEANAALATKRANAQINKISGTTNPEDIRTVLDDGVEKVRASIKSSYDEIELQAIDAQVDLSGVADLSKIMIDKVRFSAVGKSIFKDSKKFTKDFAKAAKSGDGLEAYKTLQEARSEVRATIRALKDAKGSGVQLKEAKALEKEMTDTINQALEDIDPRLAEQLIETDLAFAKLKNDIEKGLVGALLAKKGGQSKIPSESIVKTILGNSSNTKALLQAAEDFPEINAKSQLRDAFFTGYRKQVISGKVTHEAYMKQIKDTGPLIFSKSELKALENAGSAKKQITNILKRKEDRIKAINKTFNAKLSKFDPVDLVKKVSKSQSDTAKLKRILSPQEWKDYQGARRAKAVQDMTNSKGELTLDGIDKVLKGSRGEMNLSLGEQYVKDLEVAKEFLTVLAKRQSGVTAAREGVKGVTEVDVAKAMLFGPLSHTGFVIGRLKGFGRERSAKAMARLMNDPDLLRERIRIFNLPENEQLKQLQQLFGGLGLPLALNRGTGIEETEEFKQ